MESITASKYYVILSAIRVANCAYIYVCKWPYALPEIEEKNNKTALTNCQKFVMTGPPKAQNHDKTQRCNSVLLIKIYFVRPEDTQ